MKRFKWLAVPLLLLALVSLGGCAGFWAMFGIKEDGTVTPGGGILGTAATLVDLWIPGVATLVGGVTTTLAAIKAKKWRTAFVESAKVLEAGAEVGKTIEEIKPELMAAHSIAGVGVLVENALDKYVRPVEA
jgi:hypothetical protein